MSEAVPHHDPAFPALHGRPPQGWVNDPNGLAHVDGRYHVFFQHNPGAPVHHRIAWGHASSDDLLNWRQEPLALVPRNGELDELGCWTGCLVVDDGVPTAVYSGVAGARGGLAEVLLARGSSDLRTWEQGTKAVAPLPGDAEVTELRDPFVFHVDGRRYAVQGAGRVGGRPRLLVYGSDDLEHWDPLGTLLSDDDPVAARVAPAEVWECPSLVQVDGYWVLVLSLLRHEPGVRSPLVDVRYLLGDLVLGSEGPRFTARSGGQVDAGDSFYAPQLLVTDERVLMWGWAKEEGRPEADVLAAGWSGALTFARELAVVDGVLVTRPVPELVGLRSQPLTVAASEPLRERAFELLLGRWPGSLVLVDGRDEQVVASWRDDRGGRVVVDGSLVELFPDGGVPATLRAWPTPSSHWEVRAAADVVVSGWRLAVPPTSVPPEGTPA